MDVSYYGGYSFDGADIYLASGFLSLQKTLYDYFILSQQEKQKQQYGGNINTNTNYILNYNPALTHPIVGAMPFVEAHRRYLLDLANPLVSFILVLSLLYPFSQMSKRMVL